MGFRFSFAETRFTRFQAAANNQKGMNMAGELDKTSAEADELPEPEYQPLPSLIKWGIPAGIWWFLVVIVPPLCCEERCLIRGTNWAYLRLR
nr:hypothetical protein [uncultured Kingella sp.]